MISRRSLFRALPALIAAPAIVRADSLMTVIGWRDVAVSRAMSLQEAFTLDLERYVAEHVLPIVRIQLLQQEFVGISELPRGETIYNRPQRYARLPLPYVSLSEGAL